MTIITTDANDIVGKLHDRLSVILVRDEEEKWVESDTDDHPRGSVRGWKSKAELVREAYADLRGFRPD